MKLYHQLDVFDALSNETGLECKDPSLAVQSQEKESNINTIVKNFGLTGKLPDDIRAPTFADFDDIVDFQDAMNAIALARDSFMKMPANVRGRFNHDPQLFVEFCSDERNKNEMRTLGLLVPQAEAPGAAPGASPGAGGSSSGPSRAPSA